MLYARPSVLVLLGQQEAGGGPVERGQAILGLAAFRDAGDAEGEGKVQGDDRGGQAAVDVAAQIVETQPVDQL